MANVKVTLLGSNDAVIASLDIPHDELAGCGIIKYAGVYFSFSSMQGFGVAATYRECGGILDLTPPEEPSYFDDIKYVIYSEIHYSYAAPMGYVTDPKLALTFVDANEARVKANEYTLTYGGPHTLRLYETAVKDWTEQQE
jgi:hypothetical protein